MGKKDRKSIIPSDSDDVDVEGEYGSDDVSYGSDDDASGSDVKAKTKMPVVNKANVLNYASDSDSADSLVDGMDDSDELGKNIAKQREELIANDTWGQKKKSYYKDASSGDDDSENEEDIEAEAERLKKIRDAKRMKFAKKHEEEEDEDEEQD